MNVRRLFVLVLIVLALASAACTARVQYVGDLFNLGVPTNFCARVTTDDSSVVGVPLYFQGFNLWGQRVTAGIDLLTGPRQVTGGQGIACALETWAPNVYEVTAIAGDDVSFPVAVTIVSPYWCGIFAGGKLSLNTFIASNGANLQVFNTPERDATVGFIFQQRCQFDSDDLLSRRRVAETVPLCSGPRSQLLLLDPQGPTRIASTNFSVWAEVCRRGKIVKIIVRGYCKFTQDDEDTKNYPFEMTLTPYTRDWDGGEFHIKVFNYLHCLIYEACDEIQCGDVFFEDAMLPPG